MARPLRLEHGGAVWHVTSRGNERKEIFRDDADRERFLAVLKRGVERFRWSLHAYVLMGNCCPRTHDSRPDPDSDRSSSASNTKRIRSRIFVVSLQGIGVPPSTPACARLLTMSPVYSVNHVRGLYPAAV